MLAFATCVWPGLPGLWIRGEWSGLMQAIGFGLAVNFVLVSTLTTPRLVPLWAGGLAWLILGSVWAVSAVRAYRVVARSVGQAAAAGEQGLFIRAQAEYLQGHWYEAESLLRQRLGQFSGDVDAHFMLATLYRRTRRWDEAERQLKATERIDGAEKWQWEMELERRMLRRLDRSERGPQTIPAPASSDGRELDREDTQETSSC